MSTDTGLVLAIITVAALFLLRRLLAARRKDGCGGCSSCSASAPPRGQGRSGFEEDERPSDSTEVESH